MRVSFSNTEVARAAVGVLETYGYSANQVGTDVLTDCPALLAVPAIANRVGLAKVRRVDLSNRTAALESGGADFPNTTASSADRGMVDARSA